MTLEAVVTFGHDEVVEDCQDDHDEEDEESEDDDEDDVELPLICWKLLTVVLAVHVMEGLLDEAVDPCYC